MSLRGELENIKNHIIDSTLLIGLCTGFFAFLMAYYPYNLSELGLVFYSDVLSILVLTLVCVFRNKIKIQYKAVVIIIVLIVLILSDSIVWGIYSMNKVLIVIIPFYALFIFKFWKAIGIYFVALFAYLSIGYFEWYESHDPDFFMNRLASFPDWVEGAILLTTAALVLVIFTKNYNGALSNLLSDLEKKNADLLESEKQLELKNVSLNKTLEDLQLNNEKLVEYAFINSHLLRAPLARMLGLADFFSKEVKLEKHQDMIQNFKSSAEELDEIVSKINDTLERRKDLQRGEILPSSKKTK